MGGAAASAVRVGAAPLPGLLGVLAVLVSAARLCRIGGAVPDCLNAARPHPVGAYRPGVRVWLTPVDGRGRGWRIEVWPDGRARVYAVVAGWTSNAPLRDVTDIGALGEWLVGQGIDLSDLTPG